MTKKITRQIATTMKCLGGKLEIVAADPATDTERELAKEYNCLNCTSQRICTALQRCASNL